MNLIVITDEHGKQWLATESGELVYDRGEKIPPLRAKILSYSSGWADYDTSQGHCGLCGSLVCNGNCFK